MVTEVIGLCATAASVRLADSCPDSEAQGYPQSVWV